VSTFFINRVHRQQTDQSIMRCSLYLFVIVFAANRVCLKLKEQIIFYGPLLPIVGC
jgi:hypothetical protein